MAGAGPADIASEADADDTCFRVEVDAFREAYERGTFITCTSHEMNAHEMHAHKMDAERLMRAIYL